MNSYPDMLQVQGNISDERLDQSLLQPEPFFSFIKRFIFNLGKNTEHQIKHFSDKRAFICNILSKHFHRWREIYLRWNSCELLQVAADAVRLLDNRVHAQLGDLVDERVFVPFPVLHHCGQQRENLSRQTSPDRIFKNPTSTTQAQTKQTDTCHYILSLLEIREGKMWILINTRMLYRDLFGACTRWCLHWCPWRPARP